MEIKMFCWTSERVRLRLFWYDGLFRFPRSVPWVNSAPNSSASWGTVRKAVCEPEGIGRQMVRQHRPWKALLLCLCHVAHHQLHLEDYRH
jgi:hypothetical protein